jgi:hypothetical protein
VPHFHIFLPRVLLCAMRLAAQQTSIYLCHVFFYALCGLPRARLPYISAKKRVILCATRACRAPDFHKFLPRVILCATRLAARQTSIYFCQVFFNVPY